MSTKKIVVSIMSPQRILIKLSKKNQLSFAGLAANTDRKSHHFFFMQSNEQES